MCEPLERLKKQERILGVIDSKLDDGISDEEIIKYIINKYDVDSEYVRKLISDSLVQKQ